MSLTYRAMLRGRRERYLASDRQRWYLRLLLNEAFSRLYPDRTGLDPNHLERVTRAEATNAIAALLDAKRRNWTRGPEGVAA